MCKFVASKIIVDINNILPLSFNSLYIFAGAVLIEFIVFLILVSKKKLNIVRILFAVLCGNALTTLFCFFMPAGNGELGFSFYTWMTIAFAIAVVFEWLIDVAFFRDRPNKVSNLRFFFCSLIGNLLTFALITVLALRQLL